MRLWVHLIWLETNPNNTLATAGPREDRRLEELIQRFPADGELTAAIAWRLYVTAEPRPYNLEAVNIATKNTSRAGNTYIDRAEDHSSITRFPLSAFLATSEGYVVRACLLMDKMNELYKQFGTGWPKHDQQTYGAVAPAHKALNRTVGTIPRQWGAADQILTEEMSEN
jgi:hypothetical protein